MNCTFARSFNEHPNSLSLRTLICNTFIEGHPNFPQNIFSLLLEWLTPGFYRHKSCTVFWVSSFHLSVNIVVLYQFTVPGHVYRKLRIKSWSVKSLGWKKGSRLRLCFQVIDDVPEKKGMDLWKQRSSSKCSFTCICWIFLPLNPSTTTVYARSAFYPSLRFTLSLQSAF